jgi:hypothetical protein
MDHNPEGLRLQESLMREIACPAGNVKWRCFVQDIFLSLVRKDGEPANERKISRCVSEDRSFPGYRWVSVEQLITAEEHDPVPMFISRVRADVMGR